MAEVSARTEAPADSREALDLSSPDLWSNPRFHGLIVRGLERDGVDGALTGLVADVLRQALPTSYEGLRAAVLGRVDEMPGELLCSAALWFIALNRRTTARN